MPRYKKTYPQAGRTYTEKKRNNTIVLYEGSHPDGDEKRYEVHVLRYKKAHPESAQAGQMILSNPSTSEWGRYGFTFISEEKALAKFDELVAKRALTKHPTKVITLKRAGFGKAWSEEPKQTPARTSPKTDDDHLALSS